MFKCFMKKNFNKFKFTNENMISKIVKIILIIKRFLGRHDIIKKPNSLLP